METLLNAGFLIDSGLSRNDFEHNHAAQYGYVKISTTIEERNGQLRRRVLSWPKRWNEVERAIKAKMKEEHITVLHYKAREIRNNTLDATVSASLDFKKFFQQFPLATKQYWAYIAEGSDRVLLLATIPTGAVFPPLLAQSLTRTILRAAIVRSNTQTHTKFDCCIDNARLNSTNIHSLRAAWHELLDVCQKLNVTIGDKEPPPMDVQTPYTYLGMLHHGDRVELAMKSKKKALTIAKQIRTQLPRTKQELIVLRFHSMVYRGDRIQSGKCVPCHQVHAPRVSSTR